MQDQYVFLNAKALTEYDVNSIMHYSSVVNNICSSLTSPQWNDTSLLRLPHSSCKRKEWLTLTAANNAGIDCKIECAVILTSQGGFIEGQRTELSPLDIEGLRSLYGSH